MAPRLATLLLVDDERDVRATLRRALSRRGHTIVEAGSKAEALDRLRERRFDLVLTDFRMAGGDGLQLLQDARALAPGLPAILMTAFGDVPLAERAVNDHHVLRLFLKPLDADQLAQAIEESVARADVRAAEAADLAQALRRALP
jgi:DNA-binding NtrC family response regulator